MHRFMRSIFPSAECYDKSQGIVLLQVYDRSMSQNSCARTDIILKRGSRARKKPSAHPSTSNSDEKVDIPSLPSSSSSSSSAAAALLSIKTEDRNLSVNHSTTFVRSPHRRSIFFLEITLPSGQGTTVAPSISSTTLSIDESA